MEGEAEEGTDGGRAEERRAQYGQPTFYRLVNYEQATRDLDSLNAWQPDLVVLDEAQRIKNWEAKTSRAVKKLALLRTKIEAAYYARALARLSR